MIYGVILAGGIGSRMGKLEKPKQFINIGDRPILIHTIEKFVHNENFEKVIVMCPDKWVSYTKDIISKYLPESRVDVASGGAVRNESIMNAIKYIGNKYGLDDDTVLVTHDAVRPFVTRRIIEDNIACVKAGKPCSTMIPATDTIIKSPNGEYIESIPNRSHYYQAQTPQSFKAVEFARLYESLTEEERELLTDAAKVFVMKGHRVAVVKGETYNIKLTYPFDLQLAETLLRGETHGY